MVKVNIMLLLFISINVFAKVLEPFDYEKDEVSISQSITKTTILFKTGSDLLDMLIEDSWTNFSKLKSFAMQNIGEIKYNNDVIIKIEEVPFMSNGRDANIRINMNSSGDQKEEIRSYYFRFKITFKEFEEFDKFFNPTRFTFTYGNLSVLPEDLRYSIGMDDNSPINRYSSLKGKIPSSNNLIYYLPYLNIIVENDYYNEGHYLITLFSSKINNSMEIEKVNVEAANQDFHKNVRRIIEAVNNGKITSPEFAGDEIKKYYKGDVLSNAHWGSYSVKRYMSKIQLSQGSYITNRGAYALISRDGDNISYASEINNWVKYLSYALGKNYIALKSYDMSNLLTKVEFLPVNQDFNVNAHFNMKINLEIVKNIFIEDGKNELVLIIEKPMFTANRYDEYWTPLLYIDDWN